MCGLHKALCGDATEKADYAFLVGDTQIDMVFTDPPYNVPVLGHVRSRDSGHREFAEASGEMTFDEFTAFLHAILSRMAAVSRDGALHYMRMDWPHMGEMLIASHSVYSDLLNLCVWNKSNGGMGSFYRSNTNWSLSGSKGPQNTSTRLNWGVTGVIEPMFGTMKG